jgi:transcription elongation factor S-II
LNSVSKNLESDQENMTEEEIVKLNQKLKKMIDKSEIDESVARDLLVRFEELHVNLIILQKTGIGKTVNELRRATTNEDLSTTAKNLLKKWKKLVPEPSIATTSIHHGNIQLQKKDSINKIQRHEASKMTGGNATQLTTSISNVPWQTDDTARLKSRELLTNALSVTGIPEGSGDPVKLSARIEDAIFKEIKDATVKYGRRIRSRIFNLRDLKNPDLRTNVLLGNITPERLAVMTSEEMSSDSLKKECAQFKETSHREGLLAIDEGVGSDLLQCEKCQQSNCSYSELQTLSGDEPMTLFVLCRNCGHRWRG